MPSKGDFSADNSGKVLPGKGASFTEVVER